MSLDLDELRGAPGYFYLATPYSKYPDGLDAAFQQAAKAAAFFIAQQVRVFSPIAHTHPVAEYGGLDHLDHDIWLPADKPLMDGASGLIVVMMRSWKESYGIGVEIEEFRDAGKPIHYAEWND